MVIRGFDGTGTACPHKIRSDGTPINLYLILRFETVTYSRTLRRSMPTRS